VVDGPSAGELLQQAARHAAEGQADQMLLALHEARVIDGLKRRLMARWRHLNDGDAHDCIVKAIQAAYRGVREGKRLPNLDKWVVLIAHRRAIDLRRTGAKRPELRAPDILATYEDNSDSDRHRLYAKAIDISRRLLPRIGQENVRRAMEVYLDAVERGEEITHRQVGEILGVPRNTAKMLRSRGIHRLTRLAQDDGIIREEFGQSLRELMAVEDEDNDQEQDDEVSEDDA